MQLIGIEEKVYDSDDSLLGEVGFHDLDAIAEEETIKQRANELALMMKTWVNVLKTSKNGYHFISFEIFNENQHQKWIDLCSELFRDSKTGKPSDYLSNPRNSTRILRICPKPGSRFIKFMFAFAHPDHQMRLSTGHMMIYSYYRIIPASDLIHTMKIQKFFSMQPTKVNFCVYEKVLHNE